MGCAQGSVKAKVDELENTVVKLKKEIEIKEKEANDLEKVVRELQCRNDVMQEMLAVTSVEKDRLEELLSNDKDKIEALQWDIVRNRAVSPRAIRLSMLESLGPERKVSISQTAESEKELRPTISSDINNAAIKDAIDKERSSLSQPLSKLHNASIVLSEPAFSGSSRGVANTLKGTAKAVAVAVSSGKQMRVSNNTTPSKTPDPESRKVTNVTIQSPAQLFHASGPADLGVLGDDKRSESNMPDEDTETCPQRTPSFSSVCSTAETSQKGLQINRSVGINQPIDAEAAAVPQGNLSVVIEKSSKYEKGAFEDQGTPTAAKDTDGQSGIEVNLDQMGEGIEKQSQISSPRLRTLTIKKRSQGNATALEEKHGDSSDQAIEDDLADIGSLSSAMSNTSSSPHLASRARSAKMKDERGNKSERDNRTDLDSENDSKRKETDEERRITQIMSSENLHEKKEVLTSSKMLNTDTTSRQSGESLQIEELGGI